MVDPGQEPSPPADHPISRIQPPPRTVGGILARLGPGLIIAASIVGSGELIATTKTGAEAGVWLLWLILLGCVIKVFVQIEFGRFAITQGQTTMDGMNSVPGPRWRASWLMWYWLLMFTLGIGQLGGIVGGVGQSLAMTVPLTGDLRELLDFQKEEADYNRLRDSFVEEERQRTDTMEKPDAMIDAAAIEKFVGEYGPPPERPAHLSYTYDDVYWSAIVTVLTAVLLSLGRYGLIQAVATVLVASFTAVTIANLFVLQSQEAWALSWTEISEGLSFQLPPAIGDANPVFTALAAFGIIGVGASELIAYPYWCLEKGYARFTGPRVDDASWGDRARGWLRVMHWDAWLSMAVYTFATIAFYLLGAAVLHRQGLNPAGEQMIRTLAEMYVPVFGSWSRFIFLFGAIAVLYSTFFVATAGNTRMATDALRVFDVAARSDSARKWWIRFFCIVFPFASLTVFAISKQPVTLVLVSGLAQSIMLPMLGGAGLYFRFRRCDPRVRPSLLWDVLLWLSCAGLLVTGGFGLWKGVLVVLGA